MTPFGGSIHHLQKVFDPIPRWIDSWIRKSIHGWMVDFFVPNPESNGVILRTDLTSPCEIQVHSPLQGCNDSFRDGKLASRPDQADGTCFIMQVGWLQSGPADRRMKLNLPSIKIHLQLYFSKCM